MEGSVEIIKPEPLAGFLFSAINDRSFFIYRDKLFLKVCDTEDCILMEGGGEPFTYIHKDTIVEPLDVKLEIIRK